MPPHALTDAPCPCCGSDPSRPELYLDNGFGFSLSESDGHEVALVPVNTDPAEDFNAFYREQVGFLDELRREVTAEEWTRWDSAIRTAFAHGIEQVAREVGANLTAAEVTKQMFEADILARIVFDRLGPNTSIEEWVAECKRMLAEGMTPDEAALVEDILKKLTRRLAASKHEFGRDVADRLRTSHLGRWHVVKREPTPRRTSSRTPRARRQVHRARARSPGRKPPPDSEPHPVAARLGGSLRLLASAFTQVAT